METNDQSANITETQLTSHNVTSLTARQQLAAQMLAEGIALKDIAKELKVRRETVSRWRKRPAFQKQYDHIIEENKKMYIKARAEMRENLQHEVTYLMSEALRTLNRQLNHTYDNLSDRAKLALDVLKFLQADQLWPSPKHR
jgi:hypothetical protein